MSTVFIKNLPLDCNQEEFESLCSQLGPLRHCFIVLNKDKTSRGFGYVTYALAQDAVKAVESLNGMEFKESTLFAKAALKRKAEEEKTENLKAEENIVPKKVVVKKRKVQTTERGLVITGLPECTQKQLYKKVRKLGNVDNIEMKDNEATVIYSTKEEAQHALKHLHQHVFKGSNLKCSLKEIESEQVARLIIRNLSFHVNETHLKSTFEPFGSIVECKIPMKPDGKHPGFGFVQFSRLSEAKEGLKMNGEKILGRVVAVDEAVSKSEFEKMKQEEDDVESNQEETKEEEEEEEEEEMEEEMEQDMEEMEEMEIIQESIENKAPKNNLENGTLFIRNLAFDCTEDDLYQLFMKFGSLKYAKITMDKETCRPKGTGFVCFMNSSDADKCLEIYKSLDINFTLMPDLPENCPKRQFLLNGRLLSVTKAVTRKEATDLMDEGEKSRRSTDKRNTFLLKEGYVANESKEAREMEPAELEKRQKSYSLRKKLIDSNPNLYVSKTRLCVRQLPKTLDDKELKKAAIQSILDFYDQMEGRKQLEKYVLEDEELAGNPPPSKQRKIRVVQVKLLREKEAVDVKTKKLKSKGIGFIEFQSHADALMCCRMMNQTKLQEKRPIAEFALENIQVVKRRKEKSKIIKKPEAKPEPKPEPEPVQVPKKKKMTSKERKAKQLARLQSGLSSQEQKQADFINLVKTYEKSL